MAQTCRCPMCGRNNSKGKTRKLYREFNVGRSDKNRSWNGLNKQDESQLLRTRMKRDFSNQIDEMYLDAEREREEFLEFLDCYSIAA